MVWEALQETPGVSLSLLFSSESICTSRSETCRVVLKLNMPSLSGKMDYDVQTIFA
jgi:hypothetical protein